MKDRIYNILCPLVVMLLFAGCVKEENIFNMFEDVTVTLHDNSPYSATGYKEVADGDSVYIDFTITSPNKDMYQVWLVETSSETALLRIPITDDTKRRQFSSTIKLKADQRIGITSYRVFPVDKDLVYMGDDHKLVTIDVKSNMSFFTERYVFIPDAEKLKPCFLSLVNGQVFNYTEGKQNEALIDLGIDTTLVNTPGTQTFTRRLWMFSADAADKPFASAQPTIKPLFPSYDMSTWAKRATLFSTPEGSSPFTNFKTGSQLKKAAIAKINPGQKGPFQFTSGQMIYFKTQDGKYGALTATSVNSHFRGDYLEFQIKIAD